MLKIAKFRDLVRFICLKNYKMKLNTVTNPSSQLNKSTGGLKPVLPLLTEKKEVQDEDKAKYISLELRVRADGPKSSTQTYKNS